MEELNKQLTVIVQQLTLLNKKQEEHDQKMAYLNAQIEKSTKEVETKGTGNLTVDLFRIPDPIKSIPVFDGNRKQLNSWLKTAEDTLNVFTPLVTPQQYALYLQAINNKIEGKAKDILCLAGNPNTFQEMKDILLEALGDRQELSYYKSQLWATKQGESTTVHSYFNKVKEITQNIKALAKQNILYNTSWHAINTFIEEDALAAFLSGLRKPYFGYAQAAKPKSIEEAYAFLCKFNSNEIIANHSKKFNDNTGFAIQKQKMHQMNNQRGNQFEKLNKPLVQTNSMSNFRSGQNKEIPIPMEVDPSLRSRNTFIRQQINNHEILPNIENYDSNNFEEKSEFEIANFQQEDNSDTGD